jgi:hypothetical protein
MPWISRRKLDRIMKIHTAVLDERLSETERVLSAEIGATRELERRQSTHEVEVAAHVDRTRENSLRVDTLSSQMTAMTQSLQTEHDRRWSQLDEQLATHSQRAMQDRVHLEQLIEELRRSANQRTARVEQLLGQVTSRLDAGSGDTAGRVNALANEVARLSIDLRSELSVALDKAVRNIENTMTTETRAEQMAIDLTDSGATLAPSRVDLR